MCGSARREVSKGKWVFIKVKKTRANIIYGYYILYQRKKQYLGTYIIKFIDRKL